MANPTSPYGRQDVSWPDLGSDPGTTLHGQITAAIAYLSNNITARWSGTLTLAASSTAQIIHNFDSVLAGLKIFVVESGSVLSKELQDLSYSFTFVNNDTIQVQNISLVTKSFQVYVYPSNLNIRTSDFDPAVDFETTGNLYVQSRIAGQQANNAQFGTLVTLTEPTKLHTVLTAATLSSVQGIAAPADSRGRVVIFTNATGGVVSFSNDSGTAANRLLTGTGADLQLDNNASVLLKYDTSVSKWRVIGSTGGGSSAITVEQTHSLLVGQAIRYDGTNYVLAQANTAANAEVIGVVSKVVDGDTFQYVASGEITGLSGLTAGEVYFLSDATPGLLTVTEPTTVGSVSIPVGIATGTTKLMASIKRGIVVGGANLRTSIGLSNNSTTTIQNASAYDAGEVAGWIYIDATTDSRFYVQAQFAKTGVGTDYNLAYQTTGDTPPAGFSMSITSAGLIQVTLPSIAGFGSAFINFALNAPAVGATLPLQIASTNVSFTDIQASTASGITFKEDGGIAVGSVSDAGAWSFGQTPTTSSSQPHVINVSGLPSGAAANKDAVSLVGANGNTDKLITRFNRTGTGSSWTDCTWEYRRRVDSSDFQFIRYVGANDIEFGTGATVGGLLANGVWTLGPTSGLLSNTHLVYGQLSSKNSVTASLANGGTENILTTAANTTWLGVSRGSANTTQQISIISVNGAGTISATSLVTGSTPFGSGGTNTINVTNSSGVTQTIYYTFLRLL